MEYRVEVTSRRSPVEEPPAGYQDADLWFTRQYTVRCEGRTYYAWSYESKPGTVNVTHYEEDAEVRGFEFVPYRDRTFCRVARHLISKMGLHVVVWCEHRPIAVEAPRLTH